MKLPRLVCARCGARFLRSRSAPASEWSGSHRCTRCDHDQFREPRPFSAGRFLVWTAVSAFLGALLGGPMGAFVFGAMGMAMGGGEE